MSTTETLDAKLARLRSEKEARELVHVEAAKLREVAALELEAKLEPELGPRGKAFDILSTSEGPIAVKLGEAVLFKKIRAKYKGDDEPTLEDFHSFVIPCVVFPAADVFLEIVGRRPAIITECAGLLVNLYRAKEVDTRGK